MSGLKRTGQKQHRTITADEILRGIRRVQGEPKIAVVQRKGDDWISTVSFRGEEIDSARSTGVGGLDEMKRWIREMYPTASIEVRSEPGPYPGATHQAIERYEAGKNPSVHRPKIRRIRRLRVRLLEGGWLSVPSLEAASEAISEERDRLGVGLSSWRADTGDVIDARGRLVAWISYNGQIWAADA